MVITKVIFLLVKLAKPKDIGLTMWKECSKIRNSEKLQPHAIVVTCSFPHDNRGMEILLKKFLCLLSVFFKEIIVISSGKNTRILDAPAWIHWIGTDKEERGGGNIFEKIFLHTLSQLAIIKNMVALKINNAPILFWHTGFYIFPNIYARLIKMTSVLFIFGDCSVSIRGKYDGIRGSLLGKVVQWFQNSNIRLSRYIAIQHYIMNNNFGGLERFKDRIIEISQYIDVNKFMLKNPISERKIDVLYLGRLVHGKGVEKLIDSIHLLRSQRSKINFLIIGNGILETYVKQKIGAMDGVLFSNWVSHDLVPTILNDTKLLILPSETEGVPNIVIEALACGTPVVATPVGGIAGVVLPGKTGWLLSDNSPGAIARTLEEALNCPDLSAMSERAARFAREQYSFEAARRRLGRALKTMRL